MRWPPWGVPTEPRSEKTGGVDGNGGSGPNELWRYIREARTPQAPQVLGEVGLAGAPADQPEKGELVVFTGFLAANVDVPGRAKGWTLLFTDLGFNDWIIIEPEKTVRRRQVADATMMGIAYDVIWVRATAFVGRGSGPAGVNAQFLTGDFMRASDFDDEPNGGTFDAPTGIFCRARSLRCCHRKSS